MTPIDTRPYKHSKVGTVFDIVRKIDNWPTAIAARIWRTRPGLRLLHFRSGLNVVFRRGTRDWDVIHELLFANSYGHALRHLSQSTDPPTVLDLGGNIGVFSLLAAQAHPQAKVYAFEPGPPNYDLFEINRLANSSLSDRIHLYKDAVSGKTRVTEWFYDTANPGGSGLFNKNGTKFIVQIRAFSDAIRELPTPVKLAKIDIEGAEYELLEHTPSEIWKLIDFISLELHDDPAGRVSRTAFLDQMRNLGFKIQEESVCAFFLHR